VETTRPCTVREPQFPKGGAELGHGCYGAIVPVSRLGRLEVESGGDGRGWEGAANGDECCLLDVLWQLSLFKGGGRTVLSLPSYGNFPVDLLRARSVSIVRDLRISH
jgi:hypothetical protein